MTAASSIVVSAPAAPGWDPGPRPPRWFAALAALLLAAAGTAFAAYRIDGLIGTPRSVGPGICPALDLGPLTAAIGHAELWDSKDVSEPAVRGVPERRDGYSRAACTFLVKSDKAMPRAIGSLVVEWYDYQLLAEVAYAGAEGGHARSLSSAPFLRRLPGLGDSAFAGLDAEVFQPEEERMRTFLVAVRDGTVLLTVQVTVPEASGDVPWREEQAGEAYAALTRTARTALERVR
ncbi:hypothetical protein Asp14428_61830 [Actinoplanes sp. NBRC 14428]|uniref:DUF3558 domain-containing protein n=1 Tax=Pseudosporangium ferrugineum TaxID=439699 RepID=A0A2T0SCM1_9ACTN|nr:hypothetical protein [Pseudosporangium ferrugineum]PRY31167.1 hypothetical protein CLV70_10351 [Pseudosporangium ferrugineum]BCJ54708.1 hypothetical protein Asp14428_61830 [Actinoplanes sp. NBRC 14428]